MHPISEALQRHYRTTLAEHGASSRGVDWGDEASTARRHQQMLKVVRDPDRRFSILDIGCGYGAFADVLEASGLDHSYHGVDVVEEMIALARQRRPDIDVVCGDFSDLPFGKVDYAVCNGIFTQKLEASALDMERFMKAMVRKMFDTVTVGCAFNVMSSRVNFFAPNLFYMSPSELLSWCLSEVTREVSVNHAYGMYEYTVYLYK